MVKINKHDLIYNILLSILLIIIFTGLAFLPSYINDEPFETKGQMGILNGLFIVILIQFLVLLNMFIWMPTIEQSSKEDKFESKKE